MKKVILLGYIIAGLVPCGACATKIWVANGTKQDLKFRWTSKGRLGVKYHGAVPSLVEKLHAGKTRWGDDLSAAVELVNFSLKGTVKQNNKEIEFDKTIDVHQDGKYWLVKLVPGSKENSITYALYKVHYDKALQDGFKDLGKALLDLTIVAGTFGLGLAALSSGDRRPEALETKSANWQNYVDQQPVQTGEVTVIP
jgi:hypothetical protein